MLKKIDEFIRYRMARSFDTTLALSIISLLAYPFFLLVYVDTEVFIINFIGALLSLLVLIFYMYKIKYLVYPWLIFLLYTFPFQFTYGYLDNLGNSSYVVGVTIALFCIPVIVSDLFMSLSIVIIGMSLAYCLSEVNGSLVYHDLANGLLYAYIISFILALGIAKKKGNDTLKRIKGALAMSHSIAHEIRTPMTIIKIYNDELEKAEGRSRVDSAIIEYSNRKIEEQFNHIMTITDFLLLNAKSATLKNKLSFKHYFIGDCVSYVVDNYPYRQDIAKADIKINVNDNFIYYGDFTIMKNVIFNLMRNAIQSILEKGAGDIYIETISKNKHNYLIFRDTGLGVKKIQIKKILDGFFTTNETGTGLGLFFCQSAISAFGGDVSITSIFNEHFTVTIRLPMLEP